MKHYFSLRKVAAHDARVVKVGRVQLEVRNVSQIGKLIRRMPYRLTAVLIIGVFLLIECIPIFEPKLQAQTYDLNNVGGVLSATSPELAAKLKLSSQSNAFEFNEGFKPNLSGQDTSGGPQISASASQDPKKGVTVTDPVHNIDMTLIPKFAVDAPKQQQNRVVYPLQDRSGWLVYTMKADQVKEDVVLRHAPADSMRLTYELNLGNGLQAKLTPNGSIGIYGNTMLSGNVSTGSDKDAALLEKARKSAAKDTLLFMIPAPTINETNRATSKVKAHYELDGNELTVAVQGLDKANYPLSIDPSVYVTSGEQFMRGNNENNIDFDVGNGLIQKGKLTGARIPSWSAGTVLPGARWGGGYAAGGGFGYVVGGSNGSTNQSNVYWTKFDTTSSAPSAPGVCSTTVWCTETAHNLPAPRAGGVSSVVYNGYLYAIGGTDSSCAGTNNVCGTVYYIKLSANGEPIGSWSTTTALGTARRFSGIVAYRNKIYMIGGQTNTTLNGVDTIEAGSISPDGSISGWTTTGMTTMPSVRWGASAVQYNGYLYLVGGASTTTAAATVQYVKINSDGTLASTWVSANPFTNARMSFGGNFATVYNGYMYITTGCATLTTTSCSTYTPVTFTGSPNTQTDFQYASINADGSLATWTISPQRTTSPTVAGTPLTSATTTAMTGYGLMAWRGALYGIGGCTATSNVTTCSGTTQTQAKYAVILNDGDTSKMFGSSSSSYSNGTNYLYDLPTVANGGRMAGGVVVNNGYIYNIGGCNGTSGGLCGSMSPNTSYAQINSDGTLSTWTTDSTNRLNGTTGLGAFGVTVYNNTIYVVGGREGPNNTDKRSVYRVTLNANGTLSSTYSETTNVLPVKMSYTFTFARAAPNSGTSGYLYMIGGCNLTAAGTSGIGCGTYTDLVQRCTIANTGGAPGSCTSTADQQQLATPAGIFGGTTYGNYVYLAGGSNSLSNASGSTDVAPSGLACTTDTLACGAQLNTVQYAKIDSSGNITKPNGTVDNATANSGWGIASSRLTRQRRRTTAFAINGYFYVVAGHDGTTGQVDTLNDIQRGKINVNTGDITGITALSTVITDRWDLRAVQANGYIYLLGGCTAGDPPSSCTGMNGVSEYFQVYNNWSASPSSYTSSANRPTTDRYGGAATVYNGYLYLAGGCTSTAQDCSNSVTGTASTDVSYAQLGADGSIGTWNTNATYALPAARTFGRLENVGGTLYYIGGQTSAGVAQSTVYYSTPSSGVPAAWSTATNALPAAKSQFNTAVYNGRIYATGGFSGTNGTPTNSVFYSPDLSSGGDIGSAWTTNSTSFQLARSGHSTVAYGNNLYILGGYDGTNYLLDVQYAPISANGSVGTWGFGSSLPQAIRQGDAFATNGFIYVFGGRSAATTCTNNTYTVPINAEGSLGTWSQTSVKYNTTRWGVAAAYDGGRTYLLGGGCGATVTLTGNDRAVYGTLQLQPQTANYSLMIDADTDVFPTKYLINGLDNGVGANWYLNYISSTNATNTWGQSTNVGKVTLGTPGTYTPKDAAGTNTKFSRFHMMFLTIDSQAAFGYPEDVSRGPNIRDITLQFSSAPSKRLRNGKTFVNGVQQPLDTPF